MAFQMGKMWRETREHHSLTVKKQSCLRDKLMLLQNLDLYQITLKPSFFFKKIIKLSQLFTKFCLTNLISKDLKPSMDPGFVGFAPT